MLHKLNATADSQSLAFIGIEHYISELTNSQMLAKIVIISFLVLGLAFYFRSGPKIIKDGKIIKTNTGPVRGSILSARDGREYYAWHKIPYAKPPLGNLRFADPLPVDKWTVVIDGREIGSECAHGNYNGMEYTDIIGSEDCLHLNVFAPKQMHDEILQTKKAKQPVIVYIHGGGYIAGSSKMGNPGYFMDEDVVFVSLNHRLDMLGFLTTGDKIARGNQGLKDQTMGIKWVKNNIEHFGGDPNQITIYGTSAGAAGVHQQMLSPLSKGLFQRAFAQSGAASNTWGLISLEQSLDLTKKTAEALNCRSDDNQKLVDCLRNIDLETLLTSRLVPMQQNYVLLNPHKYGVAFVPIVEAVKDEHAFLTDHPLTVIAKGKAHKVPLLIGHATHEGAMITGAFLKDPKTLEEFESEIVPAVKTIFSIQNSNAEEISKQISNYYLPKEDEISLDEKINRYADLLGDALFNFDIRETVRLQRKFSPVYYYLHNKTDVPDMFWFVTEITGKLPLMVEVGWYLLKTYVKENIFRIEQPPLKWVNHGADLFYYIPIEEMGMVIRKDDKRYQYSKDLVKMVVQFANVDSKMEFRGVKILPTPSEGPIKVLEFKNDEVVLSPEPFANRMEFLRSLKIRL